MKRVLIAGWLTVFAVSATGCMTTGTEVAPETAQSFQKGKTTYDEVVAQLGTPQMTHFEGDGARTITYAYSKTTVAPESFLPFVGVLLAKGENNVTSVIFKFDPQGRLIDYSTGKDRATYKTFG
jgi:outer membrane protein assembly factor BamE (lipoprotein component of BamABCDE complex)